MPDGLLIGLRIGLSRYPGSNAIKFVQPIFLTPAGEKLGPQRGLNGDTVIEAKAPAGYAVGSVTVRGGGGLDSVTVTFMRIKGNSLDPNDDGVTRPIGGGDGSGGATVGGDGTPVIGICGRVQVPNGNLGLGLIFLRATPAAEAH